MKTLLKNLTKIFLIICIFCYLNAFLITAQNNCGMTFPNNATACDVCGPGGGSQLSVVGVASDELIVKVDPSKVDKSEQLKSSLGVTVKKTFANTGVELWKLPATIKIKEGNKSSYISNYKSKADYINKQSGILYAEPNYSYGVSSVNDPLFSYQWGLKQSGVGINSETSLDLPSGNKCGLIGVVDSGIDWQHEDLVNNIYQNLGEDADQDGSVLEWDGNKWIFDPGDENGIDDDGNGYIDDFVGWNFVDNNNNPSPIVPVDIHGTHIAGIIAAEGNNNIGVTGVCHSAEIMALKCFDSKGKGTVMDIIEAFEYCAANNVKLVNNSWGGNECSLTLYESLLNIFENDILFVCAAGNNGASLETDGYFPASYELPNVVSVISVNAMGEVSPSSNFGAKSADIAAPGECILGILPTVATQSYTGIAQTIGLTVGECYPQTPSGHDFLGGTSMAAAHVTGALGILLNRNPTITPATAKEHLVCSAKPVNNLVNKCTAGGVVDVFNLVINQNDFLIKQHNSGSNTCFSISPELPNVQYEWFFGDMPSCKIADAIQVTDKPKPCFTNKKFKHYYVEVRDVCGNVIFKECGKVSYKRDTNNDEGLNNDLCSVYPNPVKEFLNVQYDLKEEGFVNASLYSITGQKIKQLSNDEYHYKGKLQKQYPLEALESGIYFLVIDTASGRINKKIYKE